MIHDVEHFGIAYYDRNAVITDKGSHVNIIDNV